MDIFIYLLMIAFFIPPAIIFGGIFIGMFKE